MAFRNQSSLLALVCLVALAYTCGVAFVPAASRAVPAAAAVTAAATGAQLPAFATEGQEMLGDTSVVTAGGEEALFYIFILFATLITLVLAVVLREPPRV